jgi:hypothetical protein
MQHLLGLDVLALACKGRSQVVRSRQRFRMLSPEQALSHLMHLALDRLSVGVLALV